LGTKKAKQIKDPIFIKDAIEIQAYKPNRIIENATTKMLAIKRETGKTERFPPGFIKTLTIGEYVYEPRTK